MKEEIEKMSNEELRGKAVYFMSLSDPQEYVDQTDALAEEIYERVNALKREISNEEFNMRDRFWNKDDRVYIQELYELLNVFEEFLTEF